ncbi:MAG: hypothetical protein IJ679_06600, partial [Lachnospiraceae bacterium]|nr:hypothetical protein [Lachnospiraceae bacterium]
GEGRFVTLPVGVKLKKASWRAIGTDDDIFPAASFADGKVDGVIEYSYADHRVGSVPFSIKEAPVAEEVGEEPLAEETFLEGLSEASKGFKKFFPVLMALLVLILMRYIYVSAPYHGYYGSESIKQHFLKKRKKRLAKLRRLHEER